jgi:hypothetical protein
MKDYASRRWVVVGKIKRKIFIMYKIVEFIIIISTIVLSVIAIKG